MPGAARSDGAGEAGAIARLTEVLAQLDPAARDGVLGQLLAAGAVSADPFAPAPAPSRRRPRRGAVVTYRVRVDLTRTQPPLWRRLEMASDLSLADVHEVVQAAFGWTDSHLLRFSSGPDRYSRQTEHYLCPYDAGEGGTGIPEHQVRLDEVLVDVGDRLFYDYDYGDDWQHTIKLEAVLERAESAPPALCTDGRRLGPPEDCGGVHGYELICAAADPTHPDHAELAVEFARFYGDGIDPADFETTAFDRDEVNRALAGIGVDDTLSEMGDDLPGPLAELLDAVRDTSAKRRLRGLIGDARLDGTVAVDPDTAGQMMRPYAWLLDRVGDDGITLTAAGYLPPVHVEAAVADLGLAEDWIGKGNREVETLPVWDLRTSAQAMGLLRKHRGRLLLTARGRALRSDPVGLWWHVAERTPPRSTDECEAQAGLLLLLAVAAQDDEAWQDLVADVLDALGWMGAEGSMFEGAMAARAAWDTSAVLRRIGGFTDQRGTRGLDRPTADGVAFARAALSTWPDGAART